MQNAQIVEEQHGDEQTLKRNSVIDLMVQLLSLGVVHAGKESGLRRIADTHCVLGTENPIAVQIMTV